MKRIDAPFTQEQVRNLNEYQHSGRGHPFTCGGKEHRTRDHSDGEGILVAHRGGWMCPDDDYTQTWAWDAMAEVAPTSPPAGPTQGSLIVCSRCGQQWRNCVCAQTSPPASHEYVRNHMLVCESCRQAAAPTSPPAEPTDHSRHRTVEDRGQKWCYECHAPAPAPAEDERRG